MLDGSNVFHLGLFVGKKTIKKTLASNKLKEVIQIIHFTSLFTFKQP